MNLDLLKLFTFTVEEYKRFSTQLDNHKITDDYDEFSYTKTNTKLMLLRKYGNFKENVYIGNIIQEAIKKYPKNKEQLDNLMEDYNKIEKQQIEYILSDGTKLNLYETIEDVMYGMYLHADFERIKRLTKTEENLRFVCVRKYVEELESILLKVYDFLKECGEVVERKKENEKASIIYLGDTSKTNQEIKNSPYWTNLYGKDGTDEDLNKIMQGQGIEEIEILAKCMIFLEELKKDNISMTIMNNLIFPTTKKDWGDYSEAQKFYKSIKNPGISSKVRYNENHTMAYVRIFPQVDDMFIISTPHVIKDIYEISLVKEGKKKEWKIYSLGGHLESYIK